MAQHHYLHHSRKTGKSTNFIQRKLEQISNDESDLDLKICFALLILCIVSMFFIFFQIINHG